MLYQYPDDPITIRAALHAKTLEIFVHHALGGDVNRIAVITQQYQEMKMKTIWDLYMGIEFLNIPPIDKIILQKMLRVYAAKHACNRIKRKRKVENARAALETVYRYYPEVLRDIAKQFIDGVIDKNTAVEQFEAQTTI